MGKNFKDVPDPRMNRRKRHNLIDILAISLCAMICGADDFEEIEIYGQEKESFLKTFLELPNGIPSRDTFSRLFCALDKDAFSNCLYEWSKEILADLSLKLPQLNIDGKVLRGTSTAGQKKSGLCIVSAWLNDVNLILGQEKVQDKSNEKTAIPKILKDLDLENTLVSIDAIACEQKNADLIDDKGGFYLLALKKNQKNAYEQIHDRMKANKEQLLCEKDIDFGSGRIEKRDCYIDTNLLFYDELNEWKHLKTVIMIDSSREINGKVSNETRFYLSNLETTPKDFNQFVRNHWGIENKLHWTLDVVFKEDMQRNKKDNAPENLATLRKMALQMIKRINDKRSIKSRRKRAIWDNQALLDILCQVNTI